MLSIGEVLSRAARQNAKTVKAGVIFNEHMLTALQTRRHVDVLGRWFEFIHHDQLLDRIQQPRGKPFCLLTFDDGKRSGYTDTAPELERLGVPAVFYVTTRFLSEGTPLWFDRYEKLRASLGFDPVGLEPSTVKEIPLALINERVDRAYAKYGVSFDMESDDLRPMSWDDARDLMRRGFTIGAHGLRHAILTRESEFEALGDIQQCIGDVSSELGTQCRTFAFPNGNYTARLALHALRCGVETVMTTEPLWADNQFPPWRLPRIQLFGAQTQLKIYLKLVAAAGRWLANPDGTGRLHRNILRQDRHSMHRHS